MVMKRMVILLTFIVAACGGDDKKDSGATSVPADNTSGQQTPTDAFPPTWTAAPTLTPAPRVTIEYTYEPPTELPLSPFPPGGLETPNSNSGGQISPFTVTLTAEKITSLLTPQFATLTSYLKGTADIQFQAEQMRVGLTVYTTPGDPNSMRSIVIETGVALENGYIRLSAQKVYFADDNTSYESALTTSLLGTVETAVNDLVRQFYYDQSPTRGNYTITSVTVTPEGIAVEITPQV